MQRPPPAARLPSALFVARARRRLSTPSPAPAPARSAAARTRSAPTHNPHPSGPQISAFSRARATATPSLLTARPRGICGLLSAQAGCVPAMPRPDSLRLPAPYRFFFLYLEPLSALVGCYYAHFYPAIYLQLTHSPSAPVPARGAGAQGVPVGTQIVLSQLANLYLLFALNEAIVLRATADLRVWRALLFGLLVADFGHLYSVSALGPAVYWDVASWNAIDWGNVAFVYLGASMRMAFLCGIGLPH
ncbi:hypothetical protein GTA08_BOTSDO03457 [Botryosphaeria dothidea]|uniref:DUF7704 domain-containing protein n=1 Tax=Botryosphaeria dothidea TaxID=55169 RepID=A0A8H4IW05_9PEZI|nr:hypothetical protein GTA08_BOTSDO03457 [Botryosphaeria dothidea]